MISVAHARSVITGLENLKAKGVTADWIDPMIAKYQEQIARLMLLDEDGLLSYEAIMQIAGTGDREDDE